MRFVFGFLVALLAFGGVSAQNSATRVKEFNLTKANVSINGYDPVAYFAQGKAVKGKSAMSAIYGGVTYYFSTAANQATFRANPTKYEPQYGGWCAYAMGLDGSKVGIDPATFKIVDGKLYLFYNKLLTNTLTDWNKDEKNLLRKANAFWAKGK